MKLLGVGTAIGGLLIGISIDSFGGSEHSGDEKNSNAYCPVSDTYQQQVAHRGSKGYRQPLEDFSCLVDFDAIHQQQASFQLIDIRLAQQSRDNPVTDALPVSVSSLPHQTYLRNKPLLLLGEGFSRLSLARVCGRLKEAGFKSVKALVGGASAWLAAQPSTNGASLISWQAGIPARDFFFEYANGKVVVVALDKTVAERLGSLGISFHMTSSSTSAEFRNEIVRLSLEKTGGGYFPLVIVDHLGAGAEYRTLKGIPNLYRVEGGIEELLQYQQERHWTNRKRTGVPNRFMCPNA